MGQTKKQKNWEKENPKEKGKTLATKTTLGNPEENENENNHEIEFIDISEVDSVKRGRKAQIDEIVVEKMKQLPKGKAMRIPQFSVTEITDETEKKKAKAKMRARVANHAKVAGWAKVTVAFEKNGTAVAIRNA